MQTHGETSTYLCTGCPLGCRLEVDAVDGDVIEIRGFECKIGERYGYQEHTDPRRPVSTTVAISAAALPRLPVRAAEPFPKDRVVDLVALLREIAVTAPVTRGEVLVADALGTGIDVIATRSMPAEASGP
jgi:CxxC motif-containing protein